MRKSATNFIFLVLFFLTLILFLNPQKNISKEYSDFATPDELIDKNQVLSMPWQKLNGPFVDVVKTYILDAMMNEEQNQHRVN